MTIKHLLSPCCQAKIIHYGNRRRQCVQCKKTWRLHHHKRGRNPKRCNYKLVERKILDNQSVRTQKRNYYPHLSEQAIYKRSQRCLDIISEQDRQYPKLRGQYILLGDGAGYTFKDQDWTLYVFLLKPRKRNYAYVLDPIMIQGKESFITWKQAIDNIPKDIRKQIVAFVSDNFHASKKIAHHYEWIHQLCHFHLIKELHRRRGKRKKLDNQTLRERIYITICQMLKTNNHEKVTNLAKELANLYKHPKCPFKFRMMIKEFIRTRERYLAYLNYPQLTIPRTNNASESLVNLIRKRTERLKSAKSVERWAKVSTRLKNKMICNGEKPTN